MPRKALVAAEIQTALLYAHSFDLDTEEWGFYDMSGRPEGVGFDRIIWLCDEDGLRDQNRRHYHHWVTLLKPDGQLHILSIR